MKGKLVKGLIVMGVVGTQWPIIGQAQEAYQEVESGIFAVSEAKPTVEGSNPLIEEALPEEREELSAEQEEVVAYIEDYLTDYIDQQPKARGLIGDVADQALVSLAFDFGFKRESPLFDLLTNLAAGENKGSVISDELRNTYTGWFNSLTNTSERTQTVYDIPTGKNLLLYARYIDNQSNKTVLLHNGYRAESDVMLMHAKLYSDLGYNVLLPDTRSHNKSEGEYITFGHYEKEDLNRWIDQEVQNKPEQQVIVTGVSMGGATTMLSQETPHPNVIAYIEDCGYASIEQQFIDTLGLLTRYFKYIPLLSQYDTPAKTNKLIRQLNDTKTKPILGMDLYQVAPINSVDKTGVPKLFIHGSDDWFIPPAAHDQLFDKAIGYKEKLTVPGAQHGDSILVNESLYTETVRSFLTTVFNLNTKHAALAPDVNLLKNPTFEFTTSQFNEWQTSTDNRNFSTNPLNRNKHAEFVLKQARKRDLVTAFQKEQGVSFYNEGLGNVGAVGQDVPVKEGETYELSFTAKNETNAHITYPTVLYGFGSEQRVDSLKTKTDQNKSIQYRAERDETAKVTLGAKIGFKTLLSKNYTFTKFGNVQVVNADRTPPKGLEITHISVAANTCTIQGYGEANSMVLVEDAQGAEVVTLKTGSNGAFEVSVPKETKLVHMINQDYKGNSSESRVVVF
ncbi:hypothetical protein NRIC_22940 [Enterococcus florum]|uniref:Alpha/beta hydrolase n=1 Tax=Enterococcus florum TaxID=2480627 RepID=A0A4P5PMD7_9ENTE|nr:alpha/beta hydrolase [Enterococcus florum]GCF94403.1 hypothetical protein NRIC_22940 [Enterococcus florum]